MKCPNCQSECEPMWKTCPKCGADLGSPQTKEYKVVQLKASTVLSQVTGEIIQNSLNQEAKSGWIFDQCITSDYFTKMNSVMLVFYKNL